jgi:hypothetical protein
MSVGVHPMLHQLILELLNAGSPPEFLSMLHTLFPLRMYNEFTPPIAVKWHSLTLPISLILNSSTGQDSDAEHRYVRRIYTESR